MQRRDGAEYAVQGTRRLLHMKGPYGVRGRTCSRCTAVLKQRSCASVAAGTKLLSARIGDADLQRMNEAAGRLGELPQPSNHSHTTDTCA